MPTIAEATKLLRSRIRTAKLSMREIARRAGLADRTVRLFVRHGKANSTTLERLEAALSEPPAVGCGRKINHV